MRSLLIFLLFVGYALGARWYFFCEIRQTCATTTGMYIPRLNTLTLHEKDRVILEGYDQFVFDKGEVQPYLNDNNLIFLDSVAAYLKDHPDKSLEITSFYRPSERDTSLSFGFYENIGIARAVFIRNQIRQRGIDEQRIDLDYGFSDTDTLKEPLDFELYPRADQVERLKFIFSNIDFSDANFEFDSDEFRPTAAFKYYADSLKTYTELNPEKKILIIGHTDDKGTPSYNKNLGMRRAINTRNYLRKEYDITTEIDVASEGEKSPLVPNNSEANRKKNRRVKIQIQ